MKASWRVVAALATLPLLMSVAHAHDEANDETHEDVFVQVAQVRKATARFHVLDNALGAGYAQFLGCVSEPGEGAMGVHFVNGEFISDTVIDALRPEALMFAPGDGSVTLSSLLSRQDMSPEVPSYEQEGLEPGRAVIVCERHDALTSDDALIDALIEHLLLPAPQPAPDAPAT